MGNIMLLFPPELFSSLHLYAPHLVLQHDLGSPCACLTMEIDSDSRPDSYQALADASADELDFCRSCCGLEEANIFKDDANIEHVTVDEKEMMSKLTRPLQAFRNAAVACQICSMPLKVLAFFGLGSNTSPRSRVILKLRIEAAQGNPQMVIVHDGLERVIQLYTSARESILIDTRSLAPAPPTRANFSPAILQLSKLGLGRGSYPCRKFTKTAFHRKASTSFGHVYDHAASIILIAGSGKVMSSDRVACCVWAATVIGTCRWLKRTKWQHQIHHMWHLVTAGEMSSVLEPRIRPCRG